MGPGHGESVVIHLGNGQWLVVDSCIDTYDDAHHVAPLHYLRSIGVDVSKAVKLVVVSHWDDDHVRGIADVVDACPAARFCCATSLTARDFLRFVAAVSTGAVPTDGGNVSQIRRVLRILASRGKPITAAAPGRQLLGDPIVRCWSPSDHEGTLFLQYVAQSHPQAQQVMRRATPGSPNLTSVVLTIDWAQTSILLGADMETHTDARRGWRAIANEAATIGFSRGDVVKVPHHGSHTGHDEIMWSALLNPNPISVIAPYGQGAIEKRPPKSSDVRRINRLSSSTYLTARHTAVPTRRKLEVGVARSLREGMIRLSSHRHAMGIVRLRKSPGSQWQRELLGAAIRAK